MDAEALEELRICPHRGAASIAAHNAVVANWRRIQGIIAPLGSLGCQIFASSCGGEIDKPTFAIPAKCRPDPVRVSRASV